MDENEYGAGGDPGKEKPEVPEARKALVEKWESRVKESRKYWGDKGVWKQMKRNMQLAARGADKEWIDAGNYVVPITNRHINQTVAAIYAKNPKAVAKRRRRLMYKLWDGRADTLEAAMQNAAIMDPEALAIVQEVQAVRQHDLMIDRMGKTMEIAYEYYLNEQATNFKQQLKAAVRRAKVCKVGYVKLGFQRILEKRPEITAQIEDVTSKIAAVERMLKDISDGEVDEQHATMEELRLNLRDLQEQETLFVREGLIFDFPRADEITIDKNCRHLKTLAGAGWISHDFDMTPEKIQEVYGVDVTGGFTAYTANGEEAGKDCKEPRARVHEIYHKRDNQVFTICEGYCDFLKEPQGPDLKIERFWPIFPIVFNETEEDDNIYPPSDIELAEHIQKEFNRSRQSLREHRIASRPFWVEAGHLEDEDKKKLAAHAAFEVLSLASLATGQKIEDILQAGPTAPIDPNLYEVGPIFSDLLRAVGSQEANIGGTSDATATESSIAENSRSQSIDDNVDDLDEMLTDLAKAAGQVMLTELSKETIVEIVGEGAVWPDMPQSREEVAKDLFLETKAGSSGRPNQAAELAKIERGVPTLIQIPGINPKPLAERYGELLDIDTEELIADGMPSIQAINAMLAKMSAGAPGTGDPNTDPNMQGGEGSQNAPGPQQNENEPGPQPGYPEPSA